MNEENDIEREVENEGEGEYPARCETHKRERRGRWKVTTVDEPVKRWSCGKSEL